MDPKSTGQNSGEAALADLIRAWRAFNGLAYREDDRLVSSWASFLGLCDAMRVILAQQSSEPVAASEGTQEALRMLVMRAIALVPEYHKHWHSHAADAIRNLSGIRSDG